MKAVVDITCVWWMKWLMCVAVGFVGGGGGVPALCNHAMCFVQTLSTLNQSFSPLSRPRFLWACPTSGAGGLQDQGRGIDPGRGAVRQRLHASRYGGAALSHFHRKERGSPPAVPNWGILSFIDGLNVVEEACREHLQNTDALVLLSEKPFRNRNSFQASE